MFVFTRVPFFPTVCVSFYAPISNTRVRITPARSTFGVAGLNLSWSNARRALSHCGFNLHSLEDPCDWVFMWLLAFHISSFVKILVHFLEIGLPSPRFWIQSKGLTFSQDREPCTALVGAMAIQFGVCLQHRLSRFTCWESHGPPIGIWSDI